MLFKHLERSGSIKKVCLDVVNEETTAKIVSNNRSCTEYEGPGFYNLP